MKKIILCATVAFSCCGINSLYGQIHLPHGSPTLAPQLVANQTQAAEIDGETPMPFQAPTPVVVPNPFDFELSSPSPETNAAQNAGVSGVELTDSPSLNQSNLDPSSLPVGRHHRRRPNIVDTMADYSMLANTPHAGVTPVDWCRTNRTPNPIADIILRQECVEGLWAGYPAERAAECARMWEKIHGSCNNGCPVGPCQPCSVGAGINVSAASILNRYRQSHGRRRAKACDRGNASCDAGNAPCGPNSHGLNSQCATNTPNTTTPATTVATPKRPAQIATRPAH